jgi:hypothetical protein
MHDDEAQSGHDHTSELASVVLSARIPEAASTATAALIVSGLDAAGSVQCLAMKQRGSREDAQRRPSPLAAIGGRDIDLHTLPIAPLCDPQALVVLACSAQ